MKKLFAILLAAAMMLSLAACGGGNANVGGGGGNDDTIPVEERYGGHLNVPLTKVTALDPAKATGTWNYVWTRLIWEAPLTRDADGNICPNVCNYELSEDRLTLKLWVRDGVKFHDGTDVEIDDVIASVQRAVHKSPRTYVRDYISSVTKNDDGSATFTFKEYNEKTMYYIAFVNPMIGVMPKEICEKYATTFVITDLEDAIGTGPYVFTDIEDSVYVTIKKRADYVPVESDYTGPAATKYGYLDSMTFWYNTEDATTGMALMNGDYDLAEVLPEEYKELAAANGFVCETLPSNQTCTITLNTRSTSSPMAKYPSLRKAVLAAIDYEDFLNTVTDGAHVMEGPNSEFVMNPKYATDAFRNADYYGDSNIELAKQYLAKAEEEGYTGQPVVVVYNTARTDVPTLITHYLGEAGINYKLETMEQITAAAFVGDPSNPWDITFSWTTTTDRPSQLADSILDSNYKDDYKDELRAKLDVLDPDSQEYMDVWQELAQYTADGAFMGFMSRMDWWWWHLDTLHSNDEGYQRYLYNTYWDDPANHPG